MHLLRPVKSSGSLRLKGPISSSPIIGKNHLIVFSETGLGQMVDLRKKEPKTIQVIDLEDTILYPNFVNECHYRPIRQ